MKQDRNLTIPESLDQLTGAVQELGVALDRCFAQGGGSSNQLDIAALKAGQVLSRLMSLRRRINRERRQRGYISSLGEITPMTICECGLPKHCHEGENALAFRVKDRGIGGLCTGFIPAS